MDGFCYCKTPVGVLEIHADDSGITRINRAEAMHKEKIRQTPFTEAAAKQLGEYFAGRRKTFELPLSLKGTPFQLRVWEELRKIPYGKTVSYGGLAERCENKKACRAVGMANHNNPVMIVVPCHRVIGKNGSLTGYSGGLDMKCFLLELEKESSGK